MERTQGHSTALIHQTVSTKYLQYLLELAERWTECKCGCSSEARESLREDMETIYFLDRDRAAAWNVHHLSWAQRRVLRCADVQQKKFLYHRKSS